MTKYIFDLDNKVISSNEKHNLTGYTINDFIIDEYVMLKPDKTYKNSKKYFLSKSGVFCRYGKEVKANSYTYFKNAMEAREALIIFLKKHSNPRRQRSKRKKL